MAKLKNDNENFSLKEIEKMAGKRIINIELETLKSELKGVKEKITCFKSEKSELFTDRLKLNRLIKLLDKAGSVKVKFDLKENELIFTVYDAGKKSEFVLISIPEKLYENKNVKYILL